MVLRDCRSFWVDGFGWLCMVSGRFGWFAFLVVMDFIPVKMIDMKFLATIKIASFYV